MLFNYFIKEYCPSQIFAINDDSKSDGQSYINLGMELKSNIPPQKHWYKIKTKQHILPDSIKEKIDAKLIDNGYLEVYDCGKTLYVLENPVLSERN